LKVILTNSSKIFGGNERWTVSTASALRDAGHDVTMLLRSGGIVEERIAELGIRAIALPGFGGDANPFAIARLAMIFARENPDAVLLTNTKDYWIGGLAAWITRVPVRVLRLSIIRRVKDNLKYRLIYRTWVNHVVVNSREVEQGIRESAAWLAKVPITVVYNGVDPAPVAHRELEVPPGSPVVGACAHVTDRKRFEWVLNALPDRAHFVLVGDGPDLPRLRNLAVELGIAERVHFPGFDPDPRPWYPFFDINVLPSQVEGMPNAVLEAMAAGVPTLATDCGGVRELLDEGRCGVIVGLEDFDGFRDQLAALAIDHEHRARLGAAAKSRASTVFSRHQTTADLVEVLEGKS
jgi:glycosyltransferase involved in cell wall biosynthesis